MSSSWANLGFSGTSRRPFKQASYRSGLIATIETNGRLYVAD